MGAQIHSHSGRNCKLGGTYTPCRAILTVPRACTNRQPPPRDAREKSILGYSLRRQGQFALPRADYASAIALTVERQELNPQEGEPRGVVACLAGFAGIAAACGQALGALHLFGAVEAHLQALSVPNLPTDQRAYERNVAALRSQSVLPM
jgi:hypothetical protein